MQKQVVICVTHPNANTPTILERDYYHPQCCLDAGHLSDGELRDVRLGMQVVKQRDMYTRFANMQSAVVSFTYAVLPKDDAPDADCRECDHSVLGPRRHQATARATNYTKVGRGELR